MAVVDLIVRGRRVVTPAGTIPATIHVADGRIAKVSAHDDVPPSRALVDADDDLVSPGLVDIHVHVNEPGRTEWEGFRTATRAAAAGGVTTIIDMPLNSIPPTTTVDALERKRAAAAGRCEVDVGFWGGIVPGNLGDLADLVQAGVFGFKAFLVPSGVEEFPSVEKDELRRAMAALAQLGALTVVHAEAPGPIRAAELAVRGADPRRYATWLASRPDQAEEEAVATVADLSGALQARAHVLHLSSAAALGPLRAARAGGAPITAETCPHYLALASESVPDGATAYKAAPPIRGRANRDLLWAALADGTLDLIASDHSPSPPELKLPEAGDFLRAWGGIASLQLALPVVWSAARSRGHDAGDLARWMSAGPAEVARLARKGRIQPGADADLVVWDPDATFTVDPAALQHRHPVTPYAGKRLSGVVKATFVRAREVFGPGGFAATPQGRLLER